MSAPPEEGFAAAPDDAGVPIQALIRAFARKTGKKFIIDSKVHGSVHLIGAKVSNVNFSELLTIPRTSLEHGAQ